MVHHALSHQELGSVGQEGMPAAEALCSVEQQGSCPTWQLQQPCSLGSCLHCLLWDRRHLSQVVSAQTLHTQHNLMSDLPAPPWALFRQREWCSVSQQLWAMQPRVGFGVLACAAGQGSSLLCQ